MDNEDFKIKEINEIEDITNEVEKRSINDAIIEESYVEEKEYTDEEQIRMAYNTSYPEDFVEDKIIINQFYLGEMKVDPEKKKKDGGTFKSNKCILQCYTDELELRIPFFIENFTNYNPETDTLIVQKDNVLARLIKKIKESEGEDLKDNPSNRFVVKYEVIREIINQTTDIEITVEEIIKRGGYKNYTIS